MIKIKVSDLKEFKRRSAGIKAHSILPVLSCIKLQCIGNQGILTKTNLSAHVMHQIELESEMDCTVLLDESLLYSFTNACEGDTVTIKFEQITVQKERKVKVTLSDAKKKQIFQVPDVVDFPEQPVITTETESFTYPQELLESINIARGYVLTGQLMDMPATCIHVTNHQDAVEVFASDNFIMYYRKIAAKVPPAVLTKDVCDILATFTEAVYSRVGNYDLFVCGLTTYAFIRTEVKTPAFRPILERYEDTGGFIINREELVKFCQLVVSINPLKKTHPAALLSDNGQHSVRMHFNESANDLSLDVPFRVEKDFSVSDFIFNADLMLSAVQNLCYDKIKIVRFGSASVMTAAEDENFIALIQGIVHNQN